MCWERRWVLTIGGRGGLLVVRQINSSGGFRCACVFLVFADFLVFVYLLVWL